MQNQLLLQEKKLETSIGDHGMSYHSQAELYKDERLADFELLIRNTSRNILQEQGFELTNYFLDYTEMWIQKFATQGVDIKILMSIGTIIFLVFILSNALIKHQTYFPRPRQGRMMLNLPIKDHSKLCPAMERQILLLNQVHFYYLTHGCHTNLVWTMV